MTIAVAKAQEKTYPFQHRRIAKELAYLANYSLSLLSAGQVIGDVVTKVFGKDDIYRLQFTTTKAIFWTSLVQFLAIVGSVILPHLPAPPLP